jgi:hypothetical protein
MESDLNHHPNQTLNQQWERLKKIIINTSKKFFKYQEIPKTQPQFTTEENELYKGEHLLTKIIKAKEQQQRDQLIEDLRKHHPQEADQLNQSHQHEIPTLATQLRKTLKKARYHQRSLKQHQDIQAAIE